MGFGHEKLDVYRVAIEHVGWAYHFCEALKGHRNASEYGQEIVDPDSDTDPDADGKRMPTNHFTRRLTAAGEFNRYIQKVTSVKSCIS
jgi:hypothetical protein